MKNILNDKPVDYFTQRGFQRHIMDYVSEEDVRGKDVLDVGCGWGSFVKSVLRWDPRRVVGVDITAPDIETAKEHIKDPRASFMVASALELPFPDASFDTVSAWEVIEHVPKGTEAKLLSEICRVLKPGGQFYFSTPCKNVRSCAGDPAWWLIGHRHYSKNQIAKFAADANFQIRDLSAWGDMYSIVAVLNMYIAKWIFKRSPFRMDYFNDKIEQSLAKKDTGYAGLIGHFCKLPVSQNTKTL